VKFKGVGKNEFLSYQGGKEKDPAGFFSAEHSIGVERTT